MIAMGLALASQLIRPSRVNPPVDPARTLEAHVDVPPAVQDVLDRACRDCHTSSTTWPWYSGLAPISWVVINHVRDGRRHLNLSDWSAYDAARASKKLDEMCRQSRDGEMPLTSYVLAHPAAKLSADDVNVLCGWTTAARAGMGASGAPAGR
jgi:hypothetical protein